MHLFTNPAIDIHPDGETASGHWMHYLLITPDDTRIPMHGMGFTRDRYRRVDGRWLFNRVESRFPVHRAVHAALVTLPMNRAFQSGTS